MRENVDSNGSGIFDHNGDKDKDNGLLLNSNSGEDGSVSSSGSSTRKKEELFRLRQMRDGVEDLDGRLSSWAKTMALGSSGIMHDRLEKIQEENLEAEQLLEALKGQLEEHKRITAATAAAAAAPSATSMKPKKRPPKPKFQEKTMICSTAHDASLSSNNNTNSDAPLEKTEKRCDDDNDNDNDDATSKTSSTDNGAGKSRPKKRPPKPKFRHSSTSGSSSVGSSKPDHPSSPLDSSNLSLADLSRGFIDLSAAAGRDYFLTGDNTTETSNNTAEEGFQRIKNQSNLSADSLEPQKTLSDKEVEELEKKINALETQKESMEQTLVRLLKSYEGKTLVLRKEKQQIADDKDTAYNEMKTLLIEQHEESERLRIRLGRLEKKRQRFMFVAKVFLALLVFGLAGAGAYVHFMVDDITDIVGSLNYVCAPVRPGTLLTESLGIVESPWWAPHYYTKEFLFFLLCRGRKRIRMEIWRGTLWITEQPYGKLVAKKTGHRARVEAERIHLFAEGGGHQEFDSPWAIPDNNNHKKSFKTGKK